MPESGKPNSERAEKGDKALRQAINGRDADGPIPKPTTDLGFRGIRHMQRYDSVSRTRRRDN
jgi:hypothetical protein